MSITDVKFDEQGLIPAIVQHARTGRVLTLAYMNLSSLERTLETRETWFWSRSRRQLWHKGEESGNTQKVIAITVDCDHDALVINVEPAGPACHTGEDSCFHNQLDGPLGASPPDPGTTLATLYALVETRKRERPEGSYTSYLFEQGLDKILKKVGEEATETIIAAKGENSASLVSETSDLIYHLIVLLVERGITLEQVSEELIRRRTNSE